MEYFKIIDIGISKRLIKIINSFMNDVYERLARESAHQLDITKYILYLLEKFKVLLN